MVLACVISYSEPMAAPLPSQSSSPVHQLYDGITKLDEAMVQQALDQGALKMEKPAEAPGEQRELMFSCLLHVTTWDRQDCLKVMAIERLLLNHPQAPVTQDLWQGQPVMVGVTDDLFSQTRSELTTAEESSQRLDRWLQHPAFAQRGAEWGKRCVQLWLDRMEDDWYAHHFATRKLAQSMVNLWVAHGVDTEVLRQLPEEDPRRAVVEPLFQAMERVQQSDPLSPPLSRRRHRS
jgi:hypothetical protein